MTKGEIRKMRKAAIRNGGGLVGELAIKKNATASRRTFRRKAERERALPRFDVEAWFWGTRPWPFRRSE